MRVEIPRDRVSRLVTVRRGQDYELCPSACESVDAQMANALAEILRELGPWTHQA